MLQNLCAVSIHDERIPCYNLEHRLPLDAAPLQQPPNRLWSFDRGHILMGSKNRMRCYFAELLTPN